ncbi:MAG: hypothetical protein ACFC03_03200 [Candidatus Malihini olakiniferum]
MINNFEPGSTLKMIVMMKALQHDIVKNSLLNTLLCYINNCEIKRRRRLCRIDAKSSYKEAK